MHIQSFFFLSCFVFYLLRLATPVFAIDSIGIETKITAGLGIEHLKYEEKLQETSLKSNADVSNLVFRIEGVKRWENLFIGIGGTVPVVDFESKEEWLVNGMLTQTDSLSYGVVQLTAFIGYPVAQLFNPYFGLRSTWSNQKRSDFNEPTGTIISSLEITESITAHYLSLGFRSKLPVSKKWEVSYGVEYNFPYYTKTTNDGLPGWETSNINGYSWSAFSELTYNMREKLSLSLLLSIGQIHWEGSDWEIYNGGQTKWPENDTNHINSFLKFNRSF